MTPARTAELAHLATTRPPPPEQIERAMQLACATAARWPTHMSEGIDGDDLRAEAMVEAWRQLLTYDPARSASLDTWIVTGCRRGVMEALRRADPLTRAQRELFREEEKKYRIVQAHPDAQPVPEPVPPVLLFSVETIIHHDDENERHITLSETLQAPDEETILLPARLDTEALVRVALNSLDEREHYLVTEWMARKTFKQIAAGLSISETRVHQMWRKALLTMRAALAVGERREARMQLSVASCQFTVGETGSPSPTENREPATENCR